MNLRGCLEDKLRVTYYSYKDEIECIIFEDPLRNAQ
jgi:hypothetical protein